jgi:signal transduction histidine kinase
VLSDASQTFAEAGTNYQKLLDQVARTTTAVLGEGCVISLLSDDATRLHFVGLYDVDPEQHMLQSHLLRGTSLSINDISFSTRVVGSGKPLLVPIIDLDRVRADTRPEFWRLMNRVSVHALLGVPMRVQGQTIGAMIIHRHRPEQPPFDADDLALAQDLADRAALAIGNARLRLQIEQHAQALEQRVNERTAELEAANKELEAFSYSVSHDLRAPLRAIDGFSRILQEEYVGSLPDEAQEYFQLVRSNAQQMGHLVDDLLAFAHLSRQQLSRRPVDHEQLVRRCLEELADEARGRQIQIACGPLPASEGDPALLKQVWVNLIANALKYTRRRAQASIEIGSMREGAELIYFVKDNGVGFDMRYSDKLFGVFQRMHRAEEYEGTGVGLAIVQRIVHRHGGRVWAEAQVDHGARFFFSLGGAQQ